MKEPEKFTPAEESWARDVLTKAEYCLKHRLYVGMSGWCRDCEEEKCILQRENLKRAMRILGWAK